MKAYIGLDTASTTGYAVYKPVPNTAFVIEVHGTPIEQSRIIDKLSEDVLDCLVFERLHSFVNAATTRSLLERAGYLKWNAKKQGFRVLEVSPTMARAHFNCKGKRAMHALFSDWFVGAYLTTNHTDALAVAMYAAHLDNHLWGIEIPMISGVGGKVSGLGLNVEEAITHIRKMQGEEP